MDTSGRAIGQYPLSIATSLALEAAMGIHPDYKVNQAPILSYKQLWINLRTLFRNFNGALEKDTHAGPKDIADGMADEIEMIRRIVSDKTEGKVLVVFYVSNYDNIEAKYPYAFIRADTTGLQKETTIYMKKAIEQVLLEYKGDPDIRVFRLKLEAPGTHEKLPKSMIVTHQPYDLVSAKLFSELDLLESHTGKIKPKSQWHTKYLNGNDLSIIPFREDLLQVFGDKELFKPMDLKVRSELVQLAERYKWSSVTTTDMIRYGINQISNPYAKDILRKIMVP